MKTNVRHTKDRVDRGTVVPANNWVELIAQYKKYKEKEKTPKPKKVGA